MLCVCVCVFFFFGGGGGVGGGRRKNLKQTPHNSSKTCVGGSR